MSSLFDPQGKARKGESKIQKVANDIMDAADSEMDNVIALEAEHGKCINFRTFKDEDIWVFDDKFELRLKRTEE